MIAYFEWKFQMCKSWIISAETCDRLKRRVGIYENFYEELKFKLNYDVLAL
jgi:hypothetical protein